MWIEGGKADLKRMPKRVRRTVGLAIASAQLGAKHPKAKPLKGFDGAGVLEVVENNAGNTFRAVYTVRFSGVVFVLHVFQKKSTKGISTPKRNLDLIQVRMKEAERLYAEYQASSEAKEKPI